MRGSTLYCVEKAARQRRAKNLKIREEYSYLKQPPGKNNRTTWRLYTSGPLGSVIRSFLGRVCQFGQNWVSRKRVVFLCDIYMYRTKKKNFMKIRAPWATSFLRAKNLGGPLGPKKNCHKMWVYCIQNDRLGHTVSTQQTVNWSEFRSPRYCTNKGWNLTVWCRAKPNRQISALFGRYLGLLNSDHFTVCCVETVWPSRSF